MGLRLRRNADDFGIEQILRFAQWILWCPLRDRDRLPELSRSRKVIDAATDDAGLCQDRAILPLVPTMTHANRLAIVELQFTV